MCLCIVHDTRCPVCVVSTPASNSPLSCPRQVQTPQWLHTTAKCTLRNMSVWCPWQIKTPCCPVHNRFKLPAVLPTTGSDSAVTAHCCKVHTKEYICLCGVCDRFKLYAVLSTTDSDSPLSCPLRNLFDPLHINFPWFEDRKFYLITLFTFL